VTNTSTRPGPQETALGAEQMVVLGGFPIDDQPL
jgi:hypothetical protein